MCSPSLLWPTRQLWWPSAHPNRLSVRFSSGQYNNLFWHCVKVLLEKEINITIKLFFQTLGPWCSEEGNLYPSGRDRQFSSFNYVREGEFGDRHDGRADYPKSRQTDRQFHSMAASKTAISWRLADWADWGPDRKQKPDNWGRTWCSHRQNRNYNPATSWLLDQV